MLPCKRACARIFQGKEIWLLAIGLGCNRKISTFRSCARHEDRGKENNMAEREKQYWLHRITGGENAVKLTHPLLFEHGILSTGWASLSWDDFVKDSHDWNTFVKHFESEYPALRNRNSLWRFLEMKEGDIVVVPTWGVFSIYRVADDKVYTNQSLGELIPPCDLRDWNGKRAHVSKDENGYYSLYDNEDVFIDLGFFRKVEPLAIKLPRQDYADQPLYSRMKLLQTNADIYDLRESVDNAIERGRDHHPIRIHEELLESTLAIAKKTISDYAQHYTYEHLVEKYLWAIGADEVIKPAQNENKSEDGDADRVAYFDALKVAVMVQVKKHENVTDEWAVEQIIAYKANHTNEDYHIQMWVISHADNYTDEAKQKAFAHDVRMINGTDFARMILEVGLKHFE